MPAQLGARSDRLVDVRALKTVKGRRRQRRFAFEGTTLLEEAHSSGLPIEAIYATLAAYDAAPLVRQLEKAGTATFLVDERSAASLSDLETPSGLVAVAPIRVRSIDTVLAAEGVTLVLADVNDPGNAGTLLRSAEAFGASGVIFGRLGVDAYHPKVVRGAMGALFRLPLAESDPGEFASAAAAAGVPAIGLRAGAGPVGAFGWPYPVALIVGHERRGLGRWESVCGDFAGIPMPGRADSLNAAVAGSIALYEASEAARTEVRTRCQESIGEEKSQDYRP